MARLEHYLCVGKQRLRCGYTTGTCAAAAARGAAEGLLGGAFPAAVEIQTPAGIPVRVDLEDCSAGPGWAGCAARKDGGDDPDVTDGALIYARAEMRDEPGIVIDGGAGVGRVTRPGLDQPPGAAAINSVPRQMIAAQVQAVLDRTGGGHGVRIVITVPQGEALAGRTFNPRLGIEGGISILGTGGIVRPMSEAAIIDSVLLELDMVYAAGSRDVLITPGNYGEDFARDMLGLKLGRAAQCSNYIGAAIDHAVGLGFASLLLVGHLGKLSKVAAGIFNTHSQTADGRRECLTAHAALCGADRQTLEEVFQAATTDAALEVLERSGLRETVMASLTRALEEHLRRRAGEMDIAAVIFSNRYGVLGMTQGAERLMRRHS